MPTFEIRDSQTGRVVVLEGESPPTQEESARLFAQVQAPQRREGDLGFFGTLRGEAELAGSIAAQAVVEPIAGVAGVAQAINPFAEPGAGAEAVEAVRGIVPAPGERGMAVAESIGGIISEFTPQPVKDFFTFIGREFEDLKEATFQKFGAGPATAVATLPTALFEAVPALSAIKKARNIPTTISDEVIDEIGDKTRASGVQSFKTEIPAEAKGTDQIIKDLRKDNQIAAERIAGKAEPDPETVAAAKRLGVVVSPAAFSTNVAFVEVMNALKSKPGSKIRAEEFKSIEDLGQKADEFIKELGGQVDKSLLDANVRTAVEKNINDLAKTSDIAYAKVNKAIPKPTLVNPEASSEYIRRRLAELGGDATLLNKSERRLLRFSREKPNPTYGALDQTRREVGDALGKQQGEFRNDAEGVLNEVYAVLSDDQQGVADAFGVGAQYEVGRKFVAQRKQIEKEALTLFGREMAGSIIPKLATAAGKLTKGDISNFRKLVDALPQNQKGEAVATMLNEFFASGQRKKGAIGGGFATAFDSLNRSPLLKKEIFKHLPKGAEKKFNDIGIVARGIFRSKSLENNSRTARDILLALDDASLYNKLKEGSIRSGVAEAVGTGFGIPGVVTGARILVGDLLKRGKRAASDIGDELFTSAAFKKSIEDAGIGKDITGQGITKTQIFKKWLKAQPPDIKAEIAAIGFIPFITSPADPRLSVELQEIQ